MDQVAAGRAVPIHVTRPSGLRDGILASRRLRYIYVQNPKCGSSTIRNSLWTAEHALGLAGPPGVPHVYSDDQPFIDDPRRWEQVESEYVFTFARNPYARVLSAYLNKVVKHRDPLVWGNFAARHGLGEEPLAFGDFLRLVARTPSDELDPHWRPQCDLLLPDLIPYDFIGSMETFEADLQPRDALHLRRGFRCRHPCAAPDRRCRTLSPALRPARARASAADLSGRFYAPGLQPGPGAAGQGQNAYLRPIRTRSGGGAVPGGLPRTSNSPALRQQFEALRPWIAGPLLEERLLRCLCELPNASARQGLARGVRHLERGAAPGLWGRHLLEVVRPCPDPARSP